MKIVLFIQLLILGPFVVYSGPDTLVSIHCKDASFAEFSLSIERQSGLHIYYKEDWVKDLRITMNEDLILPSVALSKALAGTELKISRWNDGYVVLQGSYLPESLPEYAFNEFRKSKKEAGAEKVTQSEERYLIGRNADFTSTLQIGKKSQAVPGKLVTIKARITDGSSGEPVIGATMYIEELKNGSVSDLNGSLVMIIKPGTYHASFSFMGMQSKKHLLEVHSSGEFSVELERSVIQMKEVVVFGDQQMSMQRKDPGLEKLAAKSIREIPMLLGRKRYSESLGNVTRDCYSGGGILRT
ncbi:MAG: carboxypeptidase-like regulatory domain-containing protein [Bacteroidales bacterium]|nr:carboxypeptidase-like regulatory domain-containing protein [Bacteroidales bacterium]